MKINNVFPCFNGIELPELVTGRGYILSDVKVDRGSRHTIGIKDVVLNAKKMRRSSKYNGGLPKRKLFR